MRLLKGRLLEIATGEAGLSSAVRDRYRDKFAADGFDLPEVTHNQHVRQRASRQPKPRQPVGTALANRIEGLLGIKGGKGCGCKDLASKMDAWGIAGCEIHRVEIVAALVANRDILVAALESRNVLAGMAARFTPDMMLEAGAEYLLNLAIDDVRNAIPILPIRRPAKARIPREARPKKPAKQRKSRDGLPKKFIASLKREQDRLHTINQQQPPPEPDPFRLEPVLHFGAHVWPTPGNWQWHVKLWNLMPDLINGRCFVGLATDGNTDTAETVRAALDPRFEVYEYSNTKEGENHTFRWLQDVVPQGQDDVLIYCHSKGTKAHTAPSESVRRWSEAMYQTVIFNHDMIREKMAAGYKNCHSFRTFGKRPLSPANLWHPSGTFFAVRAKYLAGKAVKSRYGGVEAWCGDHFKASESWCEFYDNSMFTTLYDAKSSREIVEPMLIEWNRIQRYER